MKKFWPLLLILMVCACEHKPNQPTQPTKSNIEIPVFNADSAYAFVKAQTDFGPRVPNTEAHEQCAAWLVNKLSEYADTVMVQEFRTRLFNNKGIAFHHVTSFLFI